MDYLYKALQREVGAVEPELAPYSPLEAQRVEPEPSPLEEHRFETVSTVCEVEPMAPVPGEIGKKVAFPVNLERLYVLRSEPMARENIGVLEQYRVLRSRVLEIMRTHRMRTLMITSAVSGECKTTTSINLALALSQVEGIRVLLVDTDLRKSGIAEVLGVPYEVGLQDYLRSALPLSQMLLQLTDSLFFVPSGGVDQHSVELLHSGAMSDLVKEVQSYFDLIIFDSPPLFPVADARVIANLMDAVLFCVHAGRTSETVISEALALIRPKLIGTVRVGSEVRMGGNYYYPYASSAKD